MGSVVGSAVYQAGHRVEDVEIERLDLACDAIQPEPGRFVWIGLYEPDEEVLRKVQRRFGPRFRIERAGAPIRSARGRQGREWLVLARLKG